MSTHPTTELEVVRADGLQAVIDTATRATETRRLEPGGYYAIVTPDGVKEIDLTGEEHKDAPDRKRGTTTVRDVTSFLAYWAKHHDDASEVYADAERLTITAVLDAHRADSARWAGHRLTLALRVTPEWRQWMDRDDKFLDQETFAKHLEDHLAELVSPPAAEMLEVAQSIQATTKAQFQSGSRLSNGERKLQYVEDTKATAGARGEFTIPETFELVLVPFEGSAPYKLTARFRYRIEREVLRLGYKLDRPEKTVQAAFADVLKAIGEGVETPVLNGTPA